MDFNTVFDLLGQIKDDRTVPRNIRTAVERALDYLQEGEEDIIIRISSAISVLDDISNDPNMPMYTRTQIWNLVSILEVMNEKAKTGKTV